MKRPTSVTIVSWFFVVYGAILVVPVIVGFSSFDIYDALRSLETFSFSSIIDLPVEVYVLFGLISSPVMIVTGLHMLRGKNWARVLFLIWSTAGLILTANFYGFSLILGLNLLTYLLVLFILTRKRCLTYFGLVAVGTDA